MPKLKTNRGAAKRFKKTGNGGFKHRRTNRNHILTKKAQGRKRRLRGLKFVTEADHGSIEQLMGEK